MTVEVSRLPSGLAVVTDAMPHLETASLGVWVGSGSRFEENDEYGISHLLEHMAFKGTSRRTAREIVETIEAVGGDLNAGTGVEVTAYYARVLKVDVPLALDVLSDILTDPAFDPEELTREQNVIVQEIGAAEDTPDDIVFDHLQSTAFPDQAVGRSILGTPATVRSLTGRKLRAYLARTYRASDMVIAAAGAIDHASVLAEAEQRFAKFNGGFAPPPPAARFRGGSRIEVRDLEQVHVAMALEGVPQRHSDLYSLHVFTNIVGGGMSSRLFQEVREVRGLCYAIYAFHSPYADTGMFGLYAGTDQVDAPELMRVVIDQIQSAAETLTEEEVARAKAQMKAGILIALESSSARAEQLARQLITHGRPIPVEEIVAKVDAVTVESARAAGRALIARSRPALAVLGRGRGLESVATIAESLGSHATFQMALFRTINLADQPPLIEGARVFLRAPQSGDYAEWAALRETSRAFLTPWEPTWPADDLTRSAFRRRLRRYAEDQRNDQAYAYFLFRSGDQVLVGGLTLANLRRGVAQAGSLGYWVGAPYARRGYMTAAVSALVPYAFTTLRLHRVEAACIPTNAASISLLEKTGFEREGYAREYLCINGQWQDHLLYARLRDSTRR